MWESSRSFHRSLGRPPPSETARAALLAEPALIPVVRLPLSPGPKWAPPREQQLPSSGRDFRQRGIFAARFSKDADSADVCRLADVCETRLRCVEPKGVAYRRTRNISDLASALEAPGPAYAEEVMAKVFCGDWALAAWGWLPMSFNGRKLFVALQTPSADAQQSELMRAREETEHAWAEAATLSRELAEARAECAEKIHKFSSLAPRLADEFHGEARTDRSEKAHNTSPITARLAEKHHMEGECDPPREARGLFSRSTFADDDDQSPQLDVRLDHSEEQTLDVARRGIDGQVRWQKVVQRRSYSSWSRVRIPVRSAFISRVGTRWALKLREMLAQIAELWLRVTQVEVIAVRSREEEMAFFEHRPYTPCKPHPRVQSTADHASMVPAVSSLQHMSWYGDLACIQEPFAIAEVALAPSVDVVNFLRILAAKFRGAPSTRDAAATALGEALPRQMPRLSEWPRTTVPGEALTARDMLRANPTS